VQHIAKLTKLDTPPLLIHCWLLKQISKQSGFCLIMENKFLLSNIVYLLRMFILNCLEQFNSTFSLSFPRTNNSMWTLCAPPLPLNSNKKIKNIAKWIGKSTQCPWILCKTWQVSRFWPAAVVSAGLGSQPRCVSSGLGWAKQKNAELQTPINILKEKKSRHFTWLVANGNLN